MRLCLSLELCRKIGRFGLFGFYRNKVGTKEVATFYGIDMCNIVLVLGIHHVPFGICEQT